MFGQTNADTTAVQTESMGGAGKKKFVSYRRKGINVAPPKQKKVPMAFGGGEPDADEGGLNLSKLMRRGR